MKLSQFKYTLPKELVALYPQSSFYEETDEDGNKVTVRVTRPDECRLMVIHRKSQTIDLFKQLAEPETEKKKKSKSKKKTEEPAQAFIQFKDIVKYFDEGDTFVFNDTKTFPSRLYGTKEKTEAKIEVFLLRELNRENHLWDVLVEPARKIRIGNKLYFDDNMVAEVLDNTTSRGRTLRFLYDCDYEQFRELLYGLGEAPLPHYVIDARENHHATKQDLEDYQTIFAKHEGAVTAPATGLHFDKTLMKMLDIKGINNAFITLHCGLGAYHKIEVEDLSKHKMESEEMHISDDACDLVNRTKSEGHRVCAVGTSVLKATETAVGTNGQLKPYDGWTNKFLYPPYDFFVANAMVGNFYHPSSPLLMAEAAFGGYDLIMKAYELAVEHKYRFGCYGDAMLILDD